ncbi:MAG: SDR family NAD(P)-dependent oxidoreductase [Rhodospirillales bacterium]
MTLCIIVGAGPGLATALARRFGAGGYRVGLVARRAAALEAQVAELRGADIEADYRVADAGDARALRAAISELEARLGPCSVLLYNAAVLRSQGPLDLDVTTLRAELEVNLVGALVAAQAVAPGMVARGRGALLFTGGGLSLEPYPEWTSLALGKAALRSLSLSLYKELAPQGLHVAVIAVCGIIAPGGPFDPDAIAETYWRLATAPDGIEDRDVVIQPAGTDPFYNDPQRRHRATTLPPSRGRADVGR